MEQKDLFEASSERLPYVECSPQGRSGPKAPECVKNKIRTYPTWFISGTRHEGVIGPEKLARLSGFAAKKEK